MLLGEKQQQRASFLNTMYGFAISVSRSKWQLKFEYDIGF